MITHYHSVYIASLAIAVGKVRERRVIWVPTLGFMNVLFKKRLNGGRRWVQGMVSEVKVNSTFVGGVGWHGCEERKWFCHSVRRLLKKGKDVVTLVAASN